MNWRELKVGDKVRLVSDPDRRHGCCRRGFDYEIVGHGWNDEPYFLCHFGDRQTEQHQVSDGTSFEVVQQAGPW